MSRAVLWWTCGLVSLVILIAAGIWSGFDRIPSSEMTPPEGAAQRDNFLALERFSKAMGRPIMRSSDVAAFARLPPHGVLILAEGRARVLTQARVAELLRWVDRGGHLVMPAVAGETDPLMKTLKVRVAGRREQPALDPHAGRSGIEQQTAIRIEGSERVFKTSISLEWLPLETYGGALPTWSVGNSGGAHIMHFARGKGAVTVVWPWLALATNSQIGELDNAAVVWTLLNLVNRSGPIEFISQVNVPTLWEWLRESAGTILLSAFVLIGIWIWRIVPRFGPIAPEPVPDRRALVEHLRAMGRAVWRAKEDEGLRYWLACVRQSVLARAAARDPMLARESGVEQARAIAARVALASSLDAQRVRTALAGTAASLEGVVAREGFTQAIAILQEVEEHL